MKEITMSIHEFMEIQRGNLTLDDNDWKTLDKFAGEILKNPKLKVAVLTSIAYMNMQLCAYAGTEMDNLRSAKNEIVMVLQICIGIICIVMCLLEIGKSLIGNRSSDISSIIMKYGSALVGVCLIPKIFTWIARICGVQLG